MQVDLIQIEPTPGFILHTVDLIQIEPTPGFILHTGRSYTDITYSRVYFPYR